MIGISLTCDPGGGKWEKSTSFKSQSLNSSRLLHLSSAGIDGESSALYHLLISLQNKTLFVQYEF